MQASSIEVRNILKSMNYPLMEKDLVQQAKKHGASYAIIEALENIPDKTPVLTMSSMNAKANPIVGLSS